MANAAMKLPRGVSQKDVARILKAGIEAGTPLGIVLTDQEARFLPVDEMKLKEPVSPLALWKAKRDGVAS